MNIKIVKVEYIIQCAFCCIAQLRVHNCQRCRQPIAGRDASVGSSSRCAGAVVRCDDARKTPLAVVSKSKMLRIG